MANQEHLEKLKEGVEAWNEWREQDLDLEPDLKEAYLSRAQLQGANLSGAQLQGAYLVEAQLQEAYLNGAQLQGAYLSRAQLQGAHLGAVQLQGAHLDAAQLQRAFLTNAQLQGAHLGNAQLQGAYLDRAQLQGADLGGAFFDNATVFNGVYLGDEKYGWPSLVDISWGGVNLAVVDWSALKMLGDEKRARQRKDYSGRVKDRFTRLDEYRVALRACRQLEAVLQGQGLDEEAARFAYREQVIQRQVLWIQRLFAIWFFSWLVALLTGYGYRLGRILVAYVFVVLSCALAYFVLGMFYGPHNLSFFDAVLISVTAFHGRVFSEPFSHPGELWVTAFEAVAGLIIEGVFIAMLTQRFFGR